MSTHAAPEFPRFYLLAKTIDSDHEEAVLTQHVVGTVSTTLLVG